MDFVNDLGFSSYVILSTCCLVTTLDSEIEFETKSVNRE